MSSLTSPAPVVADASGAPSRFVVGEEHFLLDGRPHQVLSGAIHYFRVHPDQWADRIRKARLMGLNTVETYVPWNAHQPSPDVGPRFDGDLDLARFLDLVAAEGMHAVVRPGPFVCAEWDNGGLPAWLFTDPELGVRRHEPRFLAAVQGFFDRLLPVLAAAQVDRGGPVVLVQVENEYGAYGSDQAYLAALAAMVRAGGITVPLFTCDQADATMLADGGLPGVLRTATFGSRTAERLAVLRAAQPTGPLMCAEFWNGWFDHWGTHHHRTDAAAQAAELDALLSAGASVNLYMFCGGTNFGFTSGANDKGIYAPTTTSYDYDAPLSEDGWPTAKYHAFRAVLARHGRVPDEEPPRRAPAPELAVELDEQVALDAVVDRLGPVLCFDAPPPVEAVGQHAGFTEYTTTLPARPAGDALVLPDVRDRAVVTLDGLVLGTVDRETRTAVLAVPPTAGGTLRVLLEDQGRVNYGPRIGEPKGLLGGVRLGAEELRGWRVRPVALNLDVVRGALRPAPGGPRAGTAFHRGTFDLATSADLHLRLDGWTKGVAFVNGFALGRYWSRGPQRTLYVPGPVTRAGANELVVLELHGTADARARFVAEPDLGPDEA
ncbi:beta-galactosidase [Microlunatus capsulatus]|uniref:Beta-galactosidase n=1 Tax=Microlunatus capsulatus TaxID=99117 RepID=A0ABS4Z3B1_9ACTN|nr:beta-galactosidase [Microlunatus capsulatus]MBP2415197.1 beta-galactosidase [Microlunatus capsulatus]